MSSSHKHSSVNSKNEKCNKKKTGKEKKAKEKNYFDQRVLPPTKTRNKKGTEKERKRQKEQNIVGLKCNCSNFVRVK